LPPVVSFFLVAVEPHPMPGYRCAVAALAVPLTKPEDAPR
jgi:hypothetical protein